MPVSSPRLLSLGLACLLGSASFAVTESAAQESPQADIENAKYQFEGILIRPEFVRASPGENFYPTIKLDKDAHIVVVGAKGSWLKVVPPEGSFS